MTEWLMIGFVCVVYLQCWLAAASAALEQRRRAGMQRTGLDTTIVIVATFFIWPAALVFFSLTDE